jgi:4-amino-4-deoxy-L-arabinose transferase-like glycosyltransferase
MCAALCWMLQAWLPAGWALLGGMIAVLRLGVFSYWTNTYHAGGSLAALGGALILGALPRLMRTAKLRYAMLMGVGIAMLVLTRPYEGILLCLPVGVVLVNWIWKGTHRPGVIALARLSAATLAFAIAAVAWMGYYDYRAFGNPLTPPYTIDRNTYAIAPYYVWQHARPEPKYRYAEMRAFYHEGELSFYNHIHSVKGFAPYTLEKVGFVFLFYAGFALFPPLIMVRRIFLDRRIRFLVVCVLVLAGGMVIEIYLLPHYVAPFTAAFYAIGLQAMRHMRFWKPEGKPMGLALVRLTVVVCVLMAGIRVIASPLHFGPNEFPPSDWNESWFGPGHFGTERAQIEARLGEFPGGQLAIVRYSPGHNPEDEWVYNRADIDGSKVVWARDADAADNLELIRYYQNREVWLVEPDLTPARVSPYAIPERATHLTP